MGLSPRAARGRQKRRARPPHKCAAALIGSKPPRATVLHAYRLYRRRLKFMVTKIFIFDLVSNPDLMVPS